MSVRRGLASLELAGIAVEALSVGGLETCICLPGLKLAFDVGLCPPEVVSRDTILFTHGHLDHMGGAAYHAATRSLRNMRPPTYLMPRGLTHDFERMLDGWRSLDHSELAHRTVGIDPGEEHVLRPDLVARPFRTSHTVLSQGYVLFTRRKKLRVEYAGLPGPEIKRLRVEQEVDVSEEIEEPLVAFSGDARLDFLEREEAVRRARLLILETTFLDGSVSVEECRAKGHVHLDEVIARAELFANRAILMTHFSPRYRAREVRSLLELRLPAGLRGRVTPLLAGLG